MSNVGVKFAKLDPKAVIPSYAKPGDAGMDLTAILCDFNYTYGYYEYKFGLAVEIPEGYVGLIFPRSSCSNKTLVMANCVGVVDSGFRGELTARFRNPSVYAWAPERIYISGDRVAQLVIIPIPTVEVQEVLPEELSKTDRGTGSYGSTGA